ncbi:MAG: pyocin activator PrtN family protein [Pseudomonadota bacterium]|nr:pyocin activator PrtN family protein [Pseudomonadota bacterium]
MEHAKPAKPQVVAEAMQNIVRLEDICEPVLGLKFDVARRWHALGKLPLPAFRLGSAKRGILYVHNDDITKLIEDRRKKATQRLKTLEATR